MKKLLIIALLFWGCSGKSDCTASDGTPGVELWAVCYSIENTKRINLGQNQFTGEIPPEIGNLTNLTYLSLGGNQLTGEIPPEVCDLINNTIYNFYMPNILWGNNLINTCE